MTETITTTGDRPAPVAGSNLVAGESRGPRDVQEAIDIDTQPADGLPAVRPLCRGVGGGTIVGGIAPDLAGGSPSGGPAAVAPVTP